MWTVTFQVPAHAVDAFSKALEPDSLALSSFEVMDEDGRQIDDLWKIDLIYAEEPSPAGVSARIALIAASVSIEAPEVTIAAIPQTDWVAETLSAFPPISIDRFWVHGSHDTSTTPTGRLPLCIDAATAFGTGEHATTAGCLLALAALARRTHWRSKLAASGATGVLDIGCGTGILALGAARVWPGHVLGSDIDPEAVRFATHTARLNHLHTRVRFVVADGINARSITSSAPYAIITANILARPLCRLAKDLPKLLSPGGALILSGLLVTQIPMVANAYRAQGLVMSVQFNIGAWSTLVLRKGSSLPVSSPVRRPVSSVASSGAAP